MKDEDFLRRVDSQKMADVYGTHWLKIYHKDANHFISEKYLDSDLLKRGYEPFYEKDIAYYPSIRLRFIDSLQLNYAQYIKTKAWNTDGQDTLGHFSDSKIKSSEKILIQNTLNDIDTFYYGESSGWEVLFSMLEEAIFFFPFLSFYFLAIYLIKKSRLLWWKFLKHVFWVEEKL